MNGSTPPAVAATGLGKQFGTTWALRDCVVDLPTGCVCGLVGANGAGKSTLLRLIVGLSRATAGTLTTLGRAPSDRRDFLSSVGYLAQDVPLYPRWTVADHLRLGARLNDFWDAAMTTDRLRLLGVPLEQRVDTLSGGQRAQVGLALALGKRPQLLLLDEPVASLDPLARRNFLSTLSQAVADHELTVIFSSHLVSDLERVCDYVIGLAGSRAVFAGDLDTVLSSHRLLTSAHQDVSAIERDHVVLRRDVTPRQTRLWIRLNGPLVDPSWTAHDLGLEEIVLTYLGLTSAPLSVFAPTPDISVGGRR